MTRHDLAEIVYSWGCQNLKSPLTKTAAAEMAKLMFDSVIEGIVKDGRAVIADLGTFTVTTRAARKARNVIAGIEIDVPATRVVRFKPSPKLKEKIA